MSAVGGIREVWQFREVIKNFVSQDLKVKYRRSALGFFWSLLNPLLQMIVLSLVFSLVFRMENISLYLLAGLVPWSFLAACLDGCSMSIVSAESMLKRQYFPKLVFPLSVVLQNLVTFVLSLSVLLLALGWVLGFRPSMALFILPLSFLCITCVALGLGAVMAALTVHFRDTQHLISVALTALFYLTPIIYPLEIRRQAEPVELTEQVAATVQNDKTNGDAAPVFYKKPVIEGPIPHKYRFYFKLNPFYSIIEMFHRPIYDNMLPTPSEIGAAMGFAVVSLGGGLLIFRRIEDSLIFAL